MNVVYVTGNANKAKYFSELVGIDIEHMPADTAEIQSLNTIDVITAKAKEAYAQLQRPLLVEDTSLVLPSMGRLPGTFIKWFLDEIGCEGICRLADQDPERQAVASATFAYYDGSEITLFTGVVQGTIAQTPLGDADFGWNPVFVPVGYTQTLGQMDDTTFKNIYSQIKPFSAVHDFLQSLE